jgi:hypothetical protein
LITEYPVLVWNDFLFIVILAVQGVNSMWSRHCLHIVTFILLWFDIQYCHVFVVVTNKRGLDWMIDLYSFKITHDHNKSSAEPFFMDCRGLVPFRFSILLLFCTTYLARRPTHRKHVLCLALDVLYCWLRICCRLCIATGCLPRICLRGKVLSNRCLAMGLYVTVLSTVWRIQCILCKHPFLTWLFAVFKCSIPLHIDAVQSMHGNCSKIQRNYYVEITGDV